MNNTVLYTEQNQKQNKIVSFFSKYIEENKTLKVIELALFFILLFGSLAMFIFGGIKVNKMPTKWTYDNSVIMVRNVEYEDYDEDSAKCDVIYETLDGKASLIVTYTYEEWEDLDNNHTIDADVYITNDNEKLYFVHKDTIPTQVEVYKATRAIHASKYHSVFSIATSLLILCISLSVILFFSKVFTLYEKIWFISIMVLATIVSIILPEESANGVSGIWIMLLYLLDTFFNILCELLISKQSRWNFIVSVVVEILEILICIVLMYRFATLATTLFFWLPIDIISFINWSKHKDQEKKELTIVRKLSGWQEVAILMGIAVWTLVIGYLISGIEIISDLFKGNEGLATVVAYLDACTSAVGICNGLFIFFRYREQWIAWYVEAILELVINIVAGQFVLIVLKFGYLTNTTYGYIKWTKYIKEHTAKEKNKTLHPRLDFHE